MPQNTVETAPALAQHARVTHLTEHLANERTYLAYLRTSVSLMSFGLAINRFSLYLEELPEAPTRHRFSSALIGTGQLGIAMVFLGMALLVWAAVYYNRVFHQIEAMNFRPARTSNLVMTALVLIAGLSGLVWLVIS